MTFTYNQGHSGARKKKNFFASYPKKFFSSLMKFSRLFRLFDLINLVFIISRPINSQDNSTKLLSFKKKKRKKKKKKMACVGIVQNRFLSN